MAKPVLMIVDDEPQVLNAIERDLRSHYHSQYRIVRAGSGVEALKTTRTLLRRGTALALFLVDQRMPEMTGTEFLLEARQIFPDAKRVLLTAYADTHAAIISINVVGLDYYLMKPWDPPEEKLFPALDDLLSDWKTTTVLPFEGIRVAGTLWSASSHEVKDFLARNLVPYQWLDIENDPEAERLVMEVSQEEHHIPIVFFPDGSIMVKPTTRELAEKLGLLVSPSLPYYDLAIVGGGPSGLAAAVYGASEGLKTVLLEKEAPGGQAGTSSRIENYLGFPNGISGADLARRAVSQARKFGAELLTGDQVVGIRAEDPYRYIKLESGREIGCKALIISTGVSVRRLPAAGIDRLMGAGVYYGAALTEAAFYRDRQIFIVGGANSAGQAAVYFSRYASKVIMLIRESSLAVGMSQYLIDQVENSPAIEVWLNTEVVEASGDGRLEELCLIERTTGEERQVPADAVFIFVGAKPHTDMLGDLVKRDPAGFILTGPDLMKENRPPEGWNLKRSPYLLETSCPGVFAAGDVRHGSIKRVASAAGEGAVAIALVHLYLKTV